MPSEVREVSQGTGEQGHIMKEERAFSGVGEEKRKERVFKAEGTTKNNEIIGRPSMLGDIKESLLEWMARNEAE